MPDDGHEYQLAREDDHLGLFLVPAFVVGFVVGLAVAAYAGAGPAPTEYIGPPAIPQQRINHACGKDKIRSIKASPNEFNVNGDDAYWTVTCADGRTLIVGRKTK